MSDCPGNLTRDQIIEGLKSGRVLCVDRRDAPELEDLYDLQAQGLVSSALVSVDEQYSALKFWWSPQAAKQEGRAETVEGGSLTPAEIEAERSLFEAENPEDFDFGRNDAGQYASNETYCVFSGWVARAELTRLRAEQCDRRTVRNAALDEAAKLCDLESRRAPRSAQFHDVAYALAAKAIRALKDQIEEGGG